MIKLNDSLPDASMQYFKNGEMITASTADLFTGKKVVLFAVPGAFTPTCSASHLPGYVVLADEFKAKSVDALICLSVNDAFVMNACRVNEQDGRQCLAIAALFWGGITLYWVSIFI